MRRAAWLVALVLAVGLTSQVRSAATSTGTIKVATPGLVVDVLAPNGQKVSIPANREVPAPAGTYKTAGITQYGQETSGKKPAVWSIQSRGPYGKMKEVAVKSGQTTAIEAGAPLLVKLSVNVAKSAAKGTTVSIGLAVLGQAGESYNTGSVTRGKSRVPPPKVQIVDESGNEVVSGNFEYG